MNWIISTDKGGFNWELFLLHKFCMGNFSSSLYKRFLCTSTVKGTLELFEFIIASVIIVCLRLRRVETSIF